MYLENFTELKNVILEEGTLNEIQNTVNLERKVTVNGTRYDTLTKYRQGGSNGKFFFSLSDESFNMGLNLSILPDYPQISEFNLWESVTSLNSLYFEGSALVGFGFVPVFGFTAACLASPVAWILADLFLIPAYHHCIRKLEKIIEK